FDQTFWVHYQGKRTKRHKTRQKFVPPAALIRADQVDKAHIEFKGREGNGGRPGAEQPVSPPKSQRSTLRDHTEHLK
ncbi:hypothetical protein KA005_19510, partial [bacterium]|nr:hypothetical protein [bacterium]